MNIRSSLPDFLRHVSRFWLKTFYDFYQRHGLIRSASLAYTTLLAVTPLSIIIVSLISIFPFFDRGIQEIENFVFANFVPHTGQIVLNVLQDFQSQAHHLPWKGFIFLAITSIMLLKTMESQLNELWGLKCNRFFGISFLIHFSILTIGPILLCTSLFISSLVFSSRFLDLLFINQLLTVLPFTCSFLAYLFLYIALPCCKVKMKYAIVGAFFAALLFEFAKLGFIVYTRLIPTYSILYGALAVIPLFLIWLYVSAVIFLLGGQVVNSFRTETYKDFTLRHSFQEGAYK